MLPPVLEVYVVYHPNDPEGVDVAEAIFTHFHGTSYTGLIGGAVEVYVRRDPWDNALNAPRPIPFPDAPLPNGLPSAQIVAVVPVLGIELARAVESGGEWAGYIKDLVKAQVGHPDRVAVLPLRNDRAAIDGTRLAELLGRYQNIAAPSGLGIPEPREQLICRDLAQAIAQLISGPDSRLQVFISHTRHASDDEEEDVPALIKLVRDIIRETRLGEFFDASDLQPGRDWAENLIQQASSSALLALRTDLYATRTWCQREMLTAKNAGMPIVILDSLGSGEERGSFLMDHLPRIPVRGSDDSWSKDDIRRGLNLLVDECLKRALWNLQQRLADVRDDLGISWWAPHAPEPTTLARWMRERADAGAPVPSDGDLRILHPDPPLGTDELSTLSEMVVLMGHRGAIDVMTPRAFSARGGYVT